MHVIHPTTSLPSFDKIVAFYVCPWPKKLSFESCGRKSHGNRPTCYGVQDTAIKLDITKNYRLYFRPYRMVEEAP